MVNLLNQLQQLSLQTTSSNHAALSTPSPSQPTSINIVQASNPKGNQQSDGKKKGRGKKKNQEGKGNANKPVNESLRVEKSPRKRLNFHASYAMEII